MVLLWTTGGRTRVADVLSVTVATAGTEGCAGILARRANNTGRSPAGQSGRLIGLMVTRILVQV